MVSILQRQIQIQTQIQIQIQTQVQVKMCFIALYLSGVRKQCNGCTFAPIEEGALRILILPEPFPRLYQVALFKT